MTAIAEDEPPSEQALRGYVADGRAWVATAADGGQPVAYLIAGLVDGALHIEQVSVHAEHARRGVGRALIEHVAGWAKARGIPALTLTTFTDVPWNGPYYRRLGFRPLAPEEITPGLREIRAAEAAHGLDRWPRTSMRRDL
ncbi:MAG: GNAT family N-acetyltransferase [Streptosporangiales bacterium]|nr:GNAT family N-acetyltransferase [Streptosporangiales bacterium]